MTNGPCDMGVFWNVATLVDEYVVELPFGALPAEVLRKCSLRAGTRVCVPLGHARSYREIADAAAEISRAGMRPVVVVSAPDPGELREFDSTLAALRRAGARELITVWPRNRPLADTFEELVWILEDGGVTGNGFDRLGIGGGFGRQTPEPSARLLRAFENVRELGHDSRLDITLLTRQIHSVEKALEWEMSLRAAGNRLPVRFRLPGSGRVVPSRIVPMLLGLAAAADADPGFATATLQFVPRGAPERVVRLADEICGGNFVVESGQFGYHLSILGKRTM